MGKDLVNGETALQEGFQCQLPATGNPSNASLRLQLTALAPPQAIASAAGEAQAERKRSEVGDVRRKPLFVTRRVHRRARG